MYCDQRGQEVESYLERQTNPVFSAGMCAADNPSLINAHDLTQIARGDTILMHDTIDIY